MKTLSIALLAGAAAVGWSMTAAAAPITSPDATLYCSAGADATTNSDTSAFELSTSDVDLTIDTTTYVSDDCYGVQDHGNGVAEWTTSMQNIWAPDLLYADSTADTSATVAGFEFTITADTTTSAGEYTVEWVDTDPTTDPNLPTVFTFGLLLKAGGNDSSYLLQDVTLTATGEGTGTFNIAFENPGGNIPNLSTAALFARWEENGDIIETPEPSSLAVLGFGLAGLGAAAAWRRRRENAGL